MRDSLKLGHPAQMVSALTIDLRDATTILLWVDDKLSGENKQLQNLLMKQLPKLLIHTMTSTEELFVWMRHYADDFLKKIRIIR